MPDKAYIQTDFVVDLQTEIHVDQEANVTDDSAFLLIVDRINFERLFKKTYPDSTNDPNLIWDALFGNYPAKASRRFEGENESVRYLTGDSCEKILQHYKLFLSGIDFDHLPSGFFLTKNPVGGGVRDVLHYSAFLAEQNPQTNPLAVVLSEKKPVDALQQHHFQPPQSLWYDYLRTKIQSETTTYCSEEELKKAFIAFSNTVKRLGLAFYEPDFKTFAKEFNPIVLLSRWNTVLTQPNLKNEDINSQFNCLLQLHLTSGYGALRAISDYEGTDNPCGFLVPELFEPKKYQNGQWITTNKKYHNIPYLNFSKYYDRLKIKHINHNDEFWRYLAYQPQRNSLDYYQKGLAKIAAMNLSKKAKNEMRSLLLASSTGQAHQAQNLEEEQKELEYWYQFCELVNNSSSVTFAIATASKLLGNKHFHGVFAHYIFELKRLPNVNFLNSVALRMTELLKEIGTNELLVGIAKGENPFKKLEKFNKKLDVLLNQHKSAFYQGARFYFIDQNWRQLDLQKYIDLQWRIHKISSPHRSRGIPEQFWSTIVPLLSTFNILKLSDVNELVERLEKAGKKDYKDLTFCLSLFNDVTRPLAKHDLFKIIDEVHNRTTPFDSMDSTLEYVETHFSEAFEQGHLAKKKEALVNAQYGVNEEQIRAIQELKLSSEQTQMLIRIESAILRQNPATTDEQLRALNDHMVRLSRLITAADFTFLLEKLPSTPKEAPRNIAEMSYLIQLLSNKRSIESFRQIYYRNQIEQCTNNSLIPKYIYFIEHLVTKAKNIGSIPVPVVQELMASLVLNSDLATVHQDGFIAKMEEQLASLSAIIAKNPHLQLHLLDALNHIPEKQSNHYFGHVIDFVACIEQITAVLPAGEDEEAQKNMLTVYALLAHFHKNPMELLVLWNKITQLTEPKQRKFILELANNLIENNQEVSDLGALIETIKSQPQKFDILVNQCTKPPYPSIHQINSWLQTDDFQTHYQQFCMLPYGERRLDFAFDRTHFDEQKSLFQGTEDNFFTDERANELNRQLETNRTASIHDLREQVHTLRSGPMPLNNEQKMQLLCACIEMLARTTAQLDDKIPPKAISQELNTTQVMALYAMLTNPSTRLISEIGTGEGKSRITMILAACQVAQGKTVDFMTSDMALAERDFLTYNAFFSSLDIRTSLISLNTPKQLYQRGGVNFTDNSQLLLLRNRSDIVQEPFAFLEEEPERRCLLIDEADKFIHDKAKDSYNYASPSKELKGYAWIYPHLVNFVREQRGANPKDAFNAAALTEQFVEYVGIHDIDELHQSSVHHLNSHNPKQLITWLNSAHTALHMKEDHDYKVTADVDDQLKRVRDAEGYTRYTRQILVLDSGRPVEGATFALGVHQCLCAIENQKADKEAFVILPENETQRSSFPVTFMARYDKGAIYGVSGTARHEAPSAHKDINYEQYTYLIVPRHKTVRRKERNIWLAKDEQQQIEFMKHSVREQLNKRPQRPVLLICKNDKQSKRIHDALVADKELMTLVKACTRVHGLTEKNDEVKAIKEAGNPGTITISTVGMFGRGVDINADNLFVSSLYVPTFEDEKQIKGRTARAGKKGQYRMIPNMSDPDCPINGNTHNIDNEIDRIQKSMAINAVNQEEIAKLYAEFLEHVHQQFLTSLTNTPNAEHLELLQHWQNYLSEVQKDWDIKRVGLLDLIEHNKQDDFIAAFSAFTQEWEGKLTFVNKEKSFTTEKAPIVYAALLQHKGFFKETRKPIKEQRKYDVGDDGQARIYSTLFAKEIATLKGERAWFADFRAWKEGRGDLFPDVMATLRGERPLFANLRATISRLIEELKVWLTAKPEAAKEPEVSPQEAMEPKDPPANDAETNPTLS
ncbi:helicase-related protein [Legionella worsleiensis]|uniref:Coiled-coil protein n=1 Tax=Legionella worsleiensis TaxID=45076 RepID=A0A0W1AET7_9GAMM|nr:helicase-related protein [Legionella worsleiensis]KTD79780.1 coiled-coil protein [Legionella worsleiensis]STY32291.1 coiled-coil protein [Legionella worsleiensis]